MVLDAELFHAVASYLDLKQFHSCLDVQGKGLHAKRDALASSGEPFLLYGDDSKMNEMQIGLVQKCIRVY